MRDIRIVQAGKRVDTLEPAYFAEFGCETFVFITKEELKEQLCAYIDDPDGYEKAFYAKYGRSDEIERVQAENPPEQPSITGRVINRLRR